MGPVVCALDNKASLLWAMTTQLPVPSDANTTRGLPGPEISITSVQAGRIQIDLDTREVVPMSLSEALP
jgi:hypothetical protein